MVETIRNASTRTSVAMGHSPTASETGASRLFSAITSETSIPAANGIGSPMKYRCVPDSAWAMTLNRASRIAPQAA